MCCVAMRIQGGRSMTECMLLWTDFYKWTALEIVARLKTRRLHHPSNGRAQTSIGRPANIPPPPTLPHLPIAGVGRFGLHRLIPFVLSVPIQNVVIYSVHSLLHIAPRCIPAIPGATECSSSASRMLKGKETATPRPTHMSREQMGQQSPKFPSSLPHPPARGSRYRERTAAADIDSPSISIAHSTLR